MTKYILLSKKFEGYVVYGYTNDGYLCHFERCCYEISVPQVESMLQALGWCLMQVDFENWVAKNGLQVIKVDEDLSFERFWLEVDMARDKFKCVPLWDKASEAKKIYVFQSIKAMKWYMSKNSWYNQPLPETFLRSSWRDEWYKLSHTKPTK